MGNSSTGLSGWGQGRVRSFTTSPDRWQVYNIVWSHIAGDTPQQKASYAAKSGIHCFHFEMLLLSVWSISANELTGWPVGIFCSLIAPFNSVIAWARWQLVGKLAHLPPLSRAVCGRTVGTSGYSETLHSSAIGFP